MASAPEDGTSALDNSFLETVIIHNREYQQYSVANQVYFVPIDEDELERLDIMNNVLNRVFDGRLLFPPLSRPRRILDCGYGNGSWAVEVADQNPRCEVLGIDINPWQPEEIPRNLFTFPAHNFDLVHSQMMANGIHVNRWTEYLRDMFRVTRPGGWCQMVELYYNVQSDNGSLTDGSSKDRNSKCMRLSSFHTDHALRQWSTRYLESLQSLKDLRVPLRLPTLMREAYTLVPGPLASNRKSPKALVAETYADQRENEIGAANRENVQRFLSSLAVYPLTERLGMTIQDVHLLVAQARLEADNPAFKAYFPFLLVDDVKVINPRHVKGGMTARRYRPVCDEDRSAPEGTISSFASARTTGIEPSSEPSSAGVERDEVDPRSRAR
ncbi:hypothetical protein G7Y89_g6735 [Cudoniella acicularis]|uniref:S-adenosyl-L-methionine-dependent methyltransferase n=1 Tax=Cudoniella acicularis TaxID=354080 RepID=A0A8H4RLP7_9HELO|nr:hypothetical protein G7Y89_g6735 [Cudoniella acicularis]